MIVWKAEYETKSPLVDGQHKILIEKINQLEQLLKFPTINKKDADTLIDFLGTYAASHFKFEEQCMEQYRCPAHAANKAAHAQFMNVIKEFKVEYATKGATKDVLGKLHHVASTWIQDHILKIDIQLRPCVK